MSPEVLTELLERVEKATGPDREVDEAIALVAGYWPITENRVPSLGGPGVVWFDGKRKSKINFTASIDAALALVKRVLGQHWCWEIKEGIGFRCILWMLETDYDDRAVPTGHSAASAPLAILAALLRARIAQQSGDGK